jgi:alkyl hydroperoxide reductase subunit F
MLNESLQSQLRAYLTKMVQPVELVASLDGSQGAQELSLVHRIMPQVSCSIEPVPRSAADPCKRQGRLSKSIGT